MVEEFYPDRRLLLKICCVVASCVTRLTSLHVSRVNHANISVSLL